MEGELTEMATLVLRGPPPPLYVQISSCAVPVTTGPVLLCPSAAFTADTEGHDGREPVVLPEAAEVATELDDVGGVVEDPEVVLDEHAAMSMEDNVTEPAIAAYRVLLIIDTRRVAGDAPGGLRRIATRSVYGQHTCDGEKSSQPGRTFGTTSLCGLRTKLCLTVGTSASSASVSTRW
jgi:hypothetical protein